MNTLRKAGAFLLRDYRIESGYKTSFIMRFFESLILLVLFYFLGQLIAPDGSALLKRYSHGYFAFALIGLAFTRYFDLTLRMFSESIRQAQVTGCLESMLSTQTGCVAVVLMSSLYGLLAGAVQLVLILGAGAALFGLDLSHMNLPATLLVFLLSISIFVSFGVLSAAMVVWLKKGDPFNLILGAMASVMGGAFFPTDVMPGWMQKISALIPVSYSLDALRRTMLNGQSIAMVARPAAALLGMSAILLPLSLVIFTAVVRKGRKEGTLMEY